MTAALDLLTRIRRLHRAVREKVVSACVGQSTDELSRVAQDDEGDTIYATDEVAEALLIEHLEPGAAQAGGIVLVGEGIPGGELCLPRGRPASELAWRLLVDPIDGRVGSCTNGTGLAAGVIHVERMRSTAAEVRPTQRVGGR